MTDKDPKDLAEVTDSDNNSQADDTAPEAPTRPTEVGGRGGLDPTRYGDWEKAGRCIDF